MGYQLLHNFSHVCRLPSEVGPGREEWLVSMRGSVTMPVWGVSLHLVSPAYQRLRLVLINATPHPCPRMLASDAVVFVWVSVCVVSRAFVAAVCRVALRKLSARSPTVQEETL